MIKKHAVQTKEVPIEESKRKEFNQIKKSLAEKKDLLEAIVRERFSSPKPWRYLSSDYALNGTTETIDLVFEHPAQDDPRYVLLHLSVPFLQIGQKFSLENKARQFQKQNKISPSRIKKAILLIKRHGEVIATSETRLHCPILELETSKLLYIPQPNKSPVLPPKRFSESILNELKEAILKECLTTIAKRKNKYLRKGVWRWIEREITDPNVHFFLIILSCIYQGNSSEVLSRKYKTADDYSENPEKVIDSLFSSEVSLAEEIIQNSERHKKALVRFLCCFQQTPPFDYLKSLFLKEYRTTRDGSKARTAVFLTLKELLARCGFSGEKEVQYPLEILDELGIFQGFIMGNYSELRVDNAIKKLKHLIPDISWTPQDVYKLRDELAKMLNLPPNEFNLNAFLPQTFSVKPLATLPESPQKVASGTIQKKEQLQPLQQAAPKAKPTVPAVPLSETEVLVFDPIPAQQHKAGKKGISSSKISTAVLPTHALETSRTKPHQKAEKQPSEPQPKQATSPVTIAKAPAIQEEEQNTEVIIPVTSSTELDERKYRNFDLFGDSPDQTEESLMFALEMENSRERNILIQSEKLLSVKKGESDAEQDEELDQFQPRKPSFSQNNLNNSMPMVNGNVPQNANGNNGNSNSLAQKKSRNFPPGFRKNIDRNRKHRKPI
ncbi:MAG: hypothetical protein HQM10_25235 [Candidatus Riflebacteria bacterium]|nr:hypothetical protein [Candidatus Riflebacteria bacterium]